MRVGVFDLETSSLYANTGIVLCGCVKQWGVKGVTTIRADEFPSWEGRKSNNKAVIVAIVKELKKYDVLVAHNGQYFDKTFLNSSCLRYNLRPSVRWLKFIDPVLIARRHLRVARNSLASLLDYFEIQDTKTPIEFRHWIQASHDGNRKSMNKIVEHCQRDVVSLEQVYDKTRTLVDKIDNRGSSF
jgi:uncharacterized protein YprB with RNaseH-like and TPR domain